MLIRMREPGRKALLAKVADVFAANEVENWAGAFVLLTDNKLRIHARPAKQ